MSHIIDYAVDELNTIKLYASPTSDNNDYNYDLHVIDSSFILKRLTYNIGIRRYKCV